MERPNDDAHAELSTTEAVATVLGRNYVLYEALRMRVVNYHALAARIAPGVEDLTGKKVRLPALVVSVKRFSDSLAEERETRIEKILEGAKVTLTGGVTEVSLRAAGTPPAVILKDVLNIVPDLNSPPEIVQIPGAVKVVADEEDGKLIEAKLGRKFAVTTEGRMAKVGIRVGQKSEKMVGLASLITELLFKNGVVIQSAYIGRPDSLLVVEEKFGARAYDVLRGKAGRLRKAEFP